MEIKNTKVYGLEESISRSGLPKRLGEPIIDINYKRAYKLGNVNSGSGHDNFLKGIIVQFDINYPQYLTPQLQRYHWMDIVSSQSKMHKLTSIGNVGSSCNKYVSGIIIDVVNTLIHAYNEDPSEDNFMRVMSNLPMGYEMWMGISTNYLQLKTIYKQRKTHRLPEWREFCKWIESLPTSSLITGEVKWE